MAIQTLNTLSMPAALVICTAIVALAWLGSKNFIAGLIVAFAFFIGVLGYFTKG